MDLKKTGTMIAQKRKEKNLTQKELAQLLGVTDKAVSRWETGAGFPDMSLLQPLAQILEISITEIVMGEPTQPEKAAEQADHALVDALTYTVKKNRLEIGLILAALGVGFGMAPAYMSTINGSPADLFPVVSVALLLTAAVLAFGKKKTSGKLAKWLATGSLLAALVLEILPLGGVLVFAGPDYNKRELCSCFDLMLVGYANVGPFLAGVLTALVCIMMIPQLLGKGKRSKRATFVCTILAGILILAAPLLFGVEYLSAGGLTIVLLLFASAILQRMQ